MSIDNDEKESSTHDEPKKPASSSSSKSPKKVTMQPSAKTFGASDKRKHRPDYPKNDKVMITDALSDVRIK